MGMIAQYVANNLWRGNGIIENEQTIPKPKHTISVPVGALHNLSQIERVWKRARSIFNWTRRLLLCITLLNQPQWFLIPWTSCTKVLLRFWSVSARKSTPLSSIHSQTTVNNFRNKHLIQLGVSVGMPSFLFQQLYGGRYDSNNKSNISNSSLHIQHWMEPQAAPPVVQQRWTWATHDLDLRTRRCKK